MLNLGLQLYWHRRTPIYMEKDQQNSQLLSISSYNKPRSSQSMSQSIRMAEKNSDSFDRNNKAQPIELAYRPQTISQILNQSKRESQDKSNLLTSISRRGVRGISRSLRKLSSMALKIFESIKKEPERQQITKTVETKKKVVFDADYWNQFVSNLKQNQNRDSEQNAKPMPNQQKNDQSSYQEVSFIFSVKEPTCSSQIEDQECQLSISNSDGSQNDQSDSFHFDKLQKNEDKRGPSFEQHLKKDPSDDYERYCKQKQNAQRNKISQISQRELSLKTQQVVSEFQTGLQKSRKQKGRQSKWRKSCVIDESSEEDHKQRVKKLNKHIEKKKIYSHERIFERVKLPEVFKPKSKKYIFDSAKIIKIVKNEVARARQEQQRKQSEQMKLQQQKQKRRQAEELQSQNQQSGPEKNTVGLFSNVRNSSGNNFSTFANKGPIQSGGLSPQNPLTKKNSQNNIEAQQEKKHQGESNKNILGNAQLFSGNAFSNPDKDSLISPGNSIEKDKAPQANAQDLKPATPNQSNLQAQELSKQESKNGQKESKNQPSQPNPFLSNSPAKGLDLKNLIGIKKGQQGLREPENNSQSFPKFSTPSKNIQDKIENGSGSRIPLLHQASHQQSEQPSFNDSQMEDESQQDDKNFQKGQKTPPQNMFGLQNSMNSTPASLANNSFQNNSFSMNQPTFSLLANQPPQTNFNQPSSFGQTNLTPPNMPNININASFSSTDRSKCLQLFKPTLQPNNQSTLFGQTAPPINSNDSSRKNRNKKKQQRAFA